jgi:hypothetical protein
VREKQETGRKTNRFFVLLKQHPQRGGRHIANFSFLTYKHTFITLWSSEPKHHIFNIDV